MKTFLYNEIKDDKDYIKLYKQYNNNKIKGFKTLLKDCINSFIENYNIFLDKPYLDISYIRYKDKFIDLDLLHDIVVNDIKERGFVNA